MKRRDFFGIAAVGCLFPEHSAKAEELVVFSNEEMAEIVKCHPWHVSLHGHRGIIRHHQYPEDEARKGPITEHKVGPWHPGEIVVVYYGRDGFVEYPGSLRRQRIAKHVIGPRGYELSIVEIQVHVQRCIGFCATLNFTRWSEPCLVVEERFDISDPKLKLIECKSNNLDVPLSRAGQAKFLLGDVSARYFSREGSGWRES